MAETPHSKQSFKNSLIYLAFRNQITLRLRDFPQLTCINNVSNSGVLELQTMTLSHVKRPARWHCSGFIYPDRFESDIGNWKESYTESFLIVWSGINFLFLICTSMYRYAYACLEAFPFYFGFFKFIIFYCNVLFDIVHVQNLCFWLIKVGWFLVYINILPKLILFRRMGVDLLVGCVRKLCFVYFFFSELTIWMLSSTMKMTHILEKDLWWVMRTVCV